ncbi:hypothetical protein FRB99_003279, partial [Tulasnella sp. 403]
MAQPSKDPIRDATFDAPIQAWAAFTDPGPSNQSATLSAPPDPIRITINYPTMPLTNEEAWKKAHLETFEMMCKMRREASEVLARRTPEPKMHSLHHGTPSTSSTTHPPERPSLLLSPTPTRPLGTYTQEQGPRFTIVTERLSVSGNTCLATASKLLVKLSSKVTEEVMCGLNGVSVELEKDVDEE